MSAVSASDAFSDDESGSASDARIRSQLEREWKKGLLTRQQFDALVRAQEASSNIEKILNSFEPRKGLKLVPGIAPTF